MYKTLVLLAAGFEEIEAVTVIDLLRRSEIDVAVAGLGGKKVIGSHGIPIYCDILINDIRPNEYDVLCLPGGQPGTDNLKSDQKVLDLVQSFNQKGKLIAAICAAPTVLEEAGILEGRRVTSYPSERNVFSQSEYQNKNVVEDNNIITSRGVGTAIDFALTLVKILRGGVYRDQLAEQILWTINDKTT
jgi:4-methyl-5(b-hydroxyethyl)-thiazole monophosphate biosynthesis